MVCPRCQHLHRFQTLEEAWQVIAAFIDRYNHEWLIERLGYRTPAEARTEGRRAAARGFSRSASPPRAVAPPRALRRRGPLSGIPRNDTFSCLTSVRGTGRGLYPPCSTHDGWEPERGALLEFEPIARARSASVRSPIASSCPIPYAGYADRRRDRHAECDVLPGPACNGACRARRRRIRPSASWRPAGQVPRSGSHVLARAGEASVIWSGAAPTCRRC
jgi:hypothetical protein